VCYFNKKLIYFSDEYVERDRSSSFAKRDKGSDDNETLMIQWQKYPKKKTKIRNNCLTAQHTAYSNNSTQDKTRVSLRYFLVQLTKRSAFAKIPTARFNGKFYNTNNNSC